MSQEAQRNEMTSKKVVLELEAMDAVTVRRDVEWPASDGGTLTMDLYLPPGAPHDALLPTVVVAAGYPDPGFERMLGCKFKEMGSTVSWGKLVATSGMAAVAYTNRQPEADLHALLVHLRRNADGLGLDESRLGLWASSGNAPLALSLLLRDASERLCCAALCYPCTLDLDGSTGIADAAKTFGFANPCAGRFVDDLRSDLPLFVARAGRDQTPGLNEALDRFVAAAVTRNLPITFVNHPEGPHAFDLFHDSEETREIVRRVLGFLSFHLGR